MEQTENSRTESKALTGGLKNPPKLSELKQNYEDALSHHNAHVAQVDEWLDNMHITGSAKPEYRKGRSSVVPRLIRKQAEWRYPGLSEAFLSPEYLFTTEPVTFEDGKAAIQNGLILNNQWNTKIDKVAFIDDYVRAAVDEGGIIVRVGWEYEDEEIEVPNIVPRPITDPFRRRLIEDGARMMMQNPEAAMAQIPPDLMEAIHLSLEYQQIVELSQDPVQPMRKEIRIIKNQPTAEVCDYKNVIIDPLCKGKIKDAQFVIWKYETCKGDLNKYPDRYKNIDKIMVESNSVTNSPTSTHEDDAGGFNYKDDTRKKFDAYEYWGFMDINNTGINESFVATWVGDVMIRLEASPFPDKELPFVLIPYLPKRRHVYGEPDGALLIENQKIAGALTRGMIDIMGRSAVGQVGYRKDALDVTNMRKFEAGKDYAYNAHIDARSAFYTHVYPDIPQSAPFMLEMQYNDAESLTGIKAFASGGISGEGLGKSATAARSALDAAGKRELAILRRLASGIVQIGRKFMSMNAVFLSEEEIVRVTNEKFVTIARDDLAGKVDIKLKISTAEADDAKAQELAFMLQTVGNTMPPEYSYMIMSEIARLRQMPELAKRIEEFKPAPNPMAEKMQMLEIAKLEAEIKKIESEAIENLAEAELDAAQGAKALAERDKTDLDYVEQETGTKHVREMQKQSEKARADQQLEVTKAAFKPKDVGKAAKP